MTDQLKALGQLAAAATTEEDLYTVPDLTQATTSSLVILIDGSGERTAESYNGSSTDAPELFVEFSTSGNILPVAEKLSTCKNN